MIMLASTAALLRQLSSRMPCSLSSTCSLSEHLCHTCHTIYVIIALDIVLSVQHVVACRWVWLTWIGTWRFVSIVADQELMSGPRVPHQVSYMFPA